MWEWQRDALAAGFHLDVIAVVADFVAGGVVTVDGPPIEALPDYWVIPGFLPYDGLVILAALDRRHRPADGSSRSASARTCPASSGRPWSRSTFAR